MQYLQREIELPRWMFPAVRTERTLRNRSHPNPSEILRELEPYEFINQNKFHPNIEGQILVLLRNTISNQCNTKFGANILHK